MLGVITFGNRVGSAIGPWLGGVIYDLTGSYRYAFVTSIAALGLGRGELLGGGSPPALTQPWKGDRAGISAARFNARGSP